jgi:L-asparaginase II
MSEAMTIPGGSAAAPLIVEVSRGDLVESRHTVFFAAVDAAGRTVAAHGPVAGPVYGRSALKGLQALPLLETGAADRYRLKDAEIALACASHNGEPRQVQTVARWLDRIGLGASDLECGSHLPYHEPSAAALIRGGQAPSALHNNCSGKHAGFLSTARHLGEATGGYIGFDHPVQGRVTAALEAMCGLSLARAPRGIDGCGIPVIGIPLEKLAHAMARLADPGKLPEERKAACVRIRKAVAAEPFMVAGTGRFCTQVMERLGHRAFVKTGAEGVFCLALPDQGLGIAIKAADGAGRAAEIVAAHLLMRFGVIDAEAAAALADLLHPPIRNRADRLVGAIAVAAGAPNGDPDRRDERSGDLDRRHKRTI